MASLNQFQEQLIAMKDSNTTYQDMRQWLSERGVTASDDTIRRRLREWGATKRFPPVTPELIEQVEYLFTHNLKWSDDDIANEIGPDNQGRRLTKRQVKDIRLQHGLKRREQKATPQATMARQAATYTVVDHLVNEGPGRNYGSRWARSHLSAIEGVRTQLSDVQESLRQLVSDRVEARRRKERRRRREAYTTAGPNEVWSLDGHDKLSRYGFQIYAAIDAYSRKVLWIYCGTANKSSFCVLQQYLRAIRQGGGCPKFLRTDKGGETMLMASAQYSFYLASQDTTPGDVDNRSMFRKCYIFGPSTANVRIERLWLQALAECLQSWRDLFTLMELTDAFRKDNVADRLVMLFIFMDIIRGELNTFLLDKNAYPIRKQDRPYHVPGVPNDIYRQAPHQHAFHINQHLLEQWEQVVAAFGKLTPLLFLTA